MMYTELECTFTEIAHIYIDILLLKTYVENIISNIFMNELTFSIVTFTVMSQFGSIYLPYIITNRSYNNKKTSNGNHH